MSSRLVQHCYASRRNASIVGSSLFSFSSPASRPKRTKFGRKIWLEKVSTDTGGSVCTWMTFNNLGFIDGTESVLLFRRLKPEGVDMFAVAFKNAKCIKNNEYL